MKTIILTENQHKQLTKMFLYENKTFPIDTEKVLLVKRFLDKNFVRTNVEKFNDRGKKENVKLVSMLDNSGEPIEDKQPMTDKELHEFLVDEFKDAFSSEEERHKFLAQIIKDWYGKQIKSNGLLSVPHIS